MWLCFLIFLLNKTENTSCLTEKNMNRLRNCIWPRNSRFEERHLADFIISFYCLIYPRLETAEYSYQEMSVRIDKNKNQSKTSLQTLNATIALKDHTKTIFAISLRWWSISSTTTNIKNPFNTKVECLNDCETIEESEFMIPQNLKNVVL